MKLTDEQLRQCADAGGAAAYQENKCVWTSLDWDAETPSRDAFARAVLETSEQFREPAAPALEWISYEERIPTAEDGDAGGDVLQLDTKYGYLDMKAWNTERSECFDYWIPFGSLLNLPKRLVPPKPDPVREAFEAILAERNSPLSVSWNQHGNCYMFEATQHVFDGFKIGYAAKP